jgi:3-mercaptopyruvate sulfurtransferase SseA
VRTNCAASLPAWQPADLPGLPNSAPDDGSWTEWGNLIGAPIEKP